MTTAPGLATLNLDMFTPRGVSSEDLPAPTARVVTQRTNNGNLILVCNVEPVPEAEIQIAIDRGLPIFGPTEIYQMRAITPRLIENPEQEAAVINAKLTMPGSNVIQCLDLTTQRKRAA